MIPFAVLNSLVSDVKKIFACKLCDDFSGFVDTCGTGKRNRAGRSYWETGELSARNQNTSKSTFLNDWYPY